MIDNPFRAFLPRFVGPLIRLYQFFRLSPDCVTILGCLTGLISAFYVSRGDLIFAFGLWWLGRLFDGTDGVYARHLNRSSKFGAFLDINCDMLAYSAMILAFFRVWPEFSLNWIAIMALYVLCISGALSLGSLDIHSQAKSNRKLQLASGLAEGGETGIFYSCCLLFPQYVQTLSGLWIGVLLLTVAARATLAFRVLKSNGGHT